MKKNKGLFGALLFLLCIFGSTSCLNEEKEEERKVTHYEEQTVIVASKKLQGVVFSCGTDFIMDVYAVRKENSRQWEQLSHVSGFEYESGYEYKIRISKTGYLDYRMGDPAWTEHKLLEILSKEKKESTGLPTTFIPERYQPDSSADAPHALPYPSQEIRNQQFINFSIHSLKCLHSIRNLSIPIFLVTYLPVAGLL